MQIDFKVGDRAAQFLHSPTTGRVELKLGQETIELQNPLRLSSQFSFKQTKTWTTARGGHEITIVRHRPLFLAGFRNSEYKVSVDGAVVAESVGR